MVDLFEKLAARFTDHPITVVLDNARYHRNHYVMGEAFRLPLALLWLPTYSPNLNLIERLWKLIKADELCSEYWWGLHGRYYPSFKPFKEAIVKTLENREPDFTRKLTSLLALKFQLFDNAA